MMSLDSVLLIIAGAFAGGFANGLAGFGTGLFALGWWLVAVPPVEAVITVVIMSVIGGAQGLYAVRKFINFSEQARFLIPAIFGIFTGYFFLTNINVTILKFMVAGLLVLFGGYFTFRKNLPKLKRKYLLIDITVGFMSGAFGMMAGMSGVILTMGCSMYDWNKAQRRSLVQPFNIIVLGTVFLVMMSKGFLASYPWIIVAIALPFSIFGTQTGIYVFRRLDDHQFQRLLIWLIFLSGLVLAGREITFGI